MDERLFRRELDMMMMMADGHRHIYVFGTAGDGYAVSDEPFLRITRVYADAVQPGGLEPMAGVISLSLPTIISRIQAARDPGVRELQVSLPVWGALDAGETARFFESVLGRFEDCRFLHYNLMRAKRLVTADEYARFAATYPTWSRPRTAPTR